MGMFRQFIEAALPWSSLSPDEIRFIQNIGNASDFAYEQIPQNMLKSLIAKGAVRRSNVDGRRYVLSGEAQRNARKIDPPRTIVC